ncbi:MAG: hypothetical protein KatS3mg105_4340 [Gemmatales bacterium]|nr:MAG: hypothetical protein KatS3mg105_4340 [Gemmatales bacterium]
MVGFGSPKKADLRVGQVWGGGRCLLTRPFYLLLNSDQKRASLAIRIARRINETIKGPLGGAEKELAEPKNDQLVVLTVPPQYRLNMPRYLRVVRLIPLKEPGASYRRRLAEDLLDPSLTVTAALRLEALGPKSIDALKRGLESEHPLVRFCSAEALAYLGSPASGKELARFVEEQPALRAFSLTALASLNEAVSHVKLHELLSSKSAETRYGAFRALRAIDETHPVLAGQELAGSFWLHRAAPESPPLVHVSLTRRAEIVLFGEDVYLKPPFYFLAGEYVITATDGDDKCTISRVSTHRGVSRKQCSLKLEDAIRTIADFGRDVSGNRRILATGQHVPLPLCQCRF